MLPETAMIRTVFCFTIVTLCLLATATRAFGSYGDQLDGAPISLAVIENPDATVHVLESLLRSIIVAANVDQQSMTAREIPQFQPISSISGLQKRGLDLGISRGFSGSQAGKHLMGLSAASFANGPGR